MKISVISYEIKINIFFILWALKLVRVRWITMGILIKV